ncbi:MAG: SIS domain-containing protein, partial [Clostridia bacterium]|nr:SIS domain-containing protein [Clostridia bacterium]
TYAAQLTAFYLLAAKRIEQTANGLKRAAHVCAELIKTCDVKGLAARLKTSNAVFFLGRGVDYASAIEGSLKLREVSYLAGAGYAAGELKHGSIALMDENAVVIAVITQKELKEKSKNAVSEVAARGAKVVVITPFSDVTGAEKIRLPSCPQKYYPFLAQIPLQLIAYHTAVARGFDPDRPRNLAKSVTVE